MHKKHGLKKTCFFASLITTRDGQLCAVFMLLCAVHSFDAIPGAVIFRTGGVNCLSNIPYRGYTYVLITTIGSIGLQLHVSLVHNSACPFVVSQASDLALGICWVYSLRGLSVKVMKFEHSNPNGNNFITI